MKLQKIFLFILKILAGGIAAILTLFISLLLKNALKGHVSVQVANLAQLAVVPISVFFGYLLNKYLNKLPFSDLGLTSKHIVRDIGLGLLVSSFVTLVCLLIIAFAFFSRIQLASYHGSWFSFIGMVGIFSAAVFMEEIFFRGYILSTSQLFIKNIHICCWLNGFLFMLMHSYSFYTGDFVPLWAVAIITIGAFLSYYKVYYGSIVFPIAFHGMWDLMGTLFLEDDVKFGLVRFVDFKSIEFIIANIIAITMSMCLLMGIYFLVNKHHLQKISHE